MRTNNISNQQKPTKILSSKPHASELAREQKRQSQPPQQKVAKVTPLPGLHDTQTRGEATACIVDRDGSLYISIGFAGQSIQMPISSVEAMVWLKGIASAALDIAAGRDPSNYATGPASEVLYPIRETK